jgi:hypothetical protein
MRKLALLLAVLALAAMPSVADAAKKGKKAAKAKAPAATAQKAAAEPPIVAFFRVGTAQKASTPGAAPAAKGKKGKK